MPVESKYRIPDRGDVILRLLEAYEASSAEEVQAGRAWYRNARREVRRMSGVYSVDRRRVAAIVAALSPREPWSKNLQWAEAVLETGSHGSYGLKANGWKAERILEGEDPAEVLGGPKVTAFDRALCGDDGAVVIDTWMLTAVGWPEGAPLTAKRYRDVADALTEAARMLDVPAAELQAVVWVHVRGGAA